MFTVLLRYVKSKQEVLIPARSVEFIPDKTYREPELDGEDRPNTGGGLIINHAVEADGGCHLAFTPKGDPDWRDVFVMNEQGATVARYTL